MLDRRQLSLLSQPLDRVVHVAWFLGAIVPLSALAIVVGASPDSIASRWGTEAVTLVVSAALLSLGSFLLLRRMARRALERMDEDAVRLATLLNACTALGGKSSPAEAAPVAATYAARIARARAAFVACRTPDSRGLEWAASAGADAGRVMAEHGSLLTALAEGVVRDGHPAMRVPSGPAVPGSWIAPTTVAVPFVTDAGPVVAALIVVHGLEGGRFEPQQLDGLLTLAGLASVALANADLRRALASVPRAPACAGTAGTEHHDDLTPVGVA